MSFQNCLGCYQFFEPGALSGSYHRQCSRKLFGTDQPPLVDFGVEDLEELAKISLSRHLGITGVQSKILVELEAQKKEQIQHATHRMIITHLWGHFILKPPNPRFQEISVIEDATLHMARIAGIATVLHGLIQLKSGELAYVTRRFDRKKLGKKIKKIAVEDFCQLSGLLTERKYKTSMEKAGKIILQYSTNPGLDVVKFFDISLFSFLTGNADMHLKNFSLMTDEHGEISLTPAYDLLSTQILPIHDTEEMALTVNGKKARLTKKDFEAMGETLRIPKKAMENSFERLARAMPAMDTLLNASFLSEGLKNQYKDLMGRRAQILFK